MGDLWKHKWSFDVLLLLYQQPAVSQLSVKVNVTSCNQQPDQPAQQQAVPIVQSRLPTVLQ